MLIECRSAETCMKACLCWRAGREDKLVGHLQRRFLQQQPQQESAEIIGGQVHTLYRKDVSAKTQNSVFCVSTPDVDLQQGVF